MNNAAWNYETKDVDTYLRVFEPRNGQKRSGRMIPMIVRQKSELSIRIAYTMRYRQSTNMEAGVVSALTSMQ